MQFDAGSPVQKVHEYKCIIRIWTYPGPILDLIRADIYHVYGTYTSFLYQLLPHFFAKPLLRTDLYSSVLFTTLFMNSLGSMGLHWQGQTNISLPD